MPRRVAPGFAEQLTRAGQRPSGTACPRKTMAAHSMARSAAASSAHGLTSRCSEHLLHLRGGLDVLVVPEHVVGVVLGFHFDEPLVVGVAVGLADAARVVLVDAGVHE